MNPDISLREASVQDIQLELIRRSRFNDFNGKRIFDFLMKHRELWSAVLLDRPGVPDTKAWGLALGGLIKLRDLPRNLWNADQLFILTPTPEVAKELARLAKDEDWGGEIQVYDSKEQTDGALGVGRREYGLLSIWWD